MPEDPNSAFAREAESKFDSYLPVLTFTILGLAVQTLKFVVPLGFWVEVGALTLMFASGVLSLVRLEQRSVVFNRAALRNSTLERRNMVAREHPNDYVTASATAAKAQADLNRDQKRQRDLYVIQRYTLIGGIFLLLAARVISALPRK